MNEYIIVNKTSIQKRIEELNALSHGNKNLRIRDAEGEAIEELKNVLSQSTPLITEIEKSFDESRRQHSWAGGNLYGDGYNEEEDLTDFKYKSSKDYISNLKLDI
jgi:hypothetical protein